MADKEQDPQRRRLSAIIEVDIHEETTEEETNMVWANLFEALTSLAKTENKPVNKDSISALLQLTPEDGGQECMLRITPGLISRQGDLEVVALDVMIFGVPPQMWVAKAEWSKGKPKITQLKPFRGDNAKPKFTPFSIATYAEGIVRGREADLISNPDAFDTKTVTMSFPPEASHRIN